MAFQSSKKCKLGTRASLERSVTNHIPHMSHWKAEWLMGGRHRLRTKQDFRRLSRILDSEGCLGIYNGSWEGSKQPHELKEPCIFAWFQRYCPEGLKPPVPQCQKFCWRCWFQSGIQRQPHLFEAPRFRAELGLKAAGWIASPVFADLFPLPNSSTQIPPQCTVTFTAEESVHRVSGYLVGITVSIFARFGMDWLSGLSPVRSA